MTKEEIQKRLEFLEQAKASAIAKANSIVGQISELEFWLKKLEEKEPNLKLVPEQEPAVK